MPLMGSSSLATKMVGYHENVLMTAEQLSLTKRGEHTQLKKNRRNEIIYINEQTNEQINKQMNEWMTECMRLCSLVAII